MNPYENICTLLNVIESLVTCTIKAVFIHKPQYSAAHYVEDVQFAWSSGFRFAMHTLCRLVSFSVPFHNESGKKPIPLNLHGAAKSKLDYSIDWQMYRSFSHITRDVQVYHSKNKLVVLTTERLPWMQTSWRDSGYGIRQPERKLFYNLDLVDIYHWSCFFERGHTCMHVIISCRYSNLHERITTKASFFLVTCSQLFWGLSVVRYDLGSGCSCN